MASNVPQNPERGPGGPREQPKMVLPAILHAVEATRRAVYNVLWHQVPLVVGEFKHAYRNLTTIGTLASGTVMGLVLSAFIRDRGLMPTLPPKESESAALGRIVLTDEQKKRMKGRNREDIIRAKNLNIRSIPNAAILKKMADAGKVVPLELADTPFTIDPVEFGEHAKPDKKGGDRRKGEEYKLLSHVHPDLYAFLTGPLETEVRRLKAEYGIPENMRLAITSAVRTDDYVGRMQGKEAAAAVVGRSMHANGGDAIDISYSKLLDTDKKPYKATRIGDNEKWQDFMNGIRLFLISQEEAGNVFFAEEVAGSWHFGLQQVSNNTADFATEIDKINADRRAEAERVRIATEKEAVRKKLQQALRNRGARKRGARTPSKKAPTAPTTRPRRVLPKSPVSKGKKGKGPTVAPKSKPQKTVPNAGKKPQPVRNKKGRR